MDNTVPIHKERSLLERIRNLSNEDIDKIKFEDSRIDQIIKQARNHVIENIISKQYRAEEITKIKFKSSKKASR